MNDTRFGNVSPALSRVRPEDWEAYYPIFSAPETSQFSDFPRKPTEKRTRGFVNWMVRDRGGPESTIHAMHTRVLN